MLQNLYEPISLATSSTMLVLFFVLVFLHTPERREWGHFQLATRLISLACLLLSVSYMSSFLHIDDARSDGGYLQSIITLLVGCLQALLFTCTSVILVSPNALLWRRAVRHLLGITCGALAGIAAYCMLPTWRLWNVMTCGVAYLTYIIFLTVYFRRNYSLSVQHLEDMYADDMQIRLRWVQTFFYGALGVGLFALLAALTPNVMLKMVFDISVPLYYIYVTIRLVNYITTSSFVVKTFATDATPQQHDVPCVEPKATEKVECALDMWVNTHRYAETDTTVDEIVTELGVDKQDFNSYFKNVLHTPFRTWRRELRIREAMRIMEARPMLSITELMAEVGYNDRSNFYKDFQQIAGIALKDYRNKG